MKILRVTAYLKYGKNVEREEGEGIVNPVSKVGFDFDFNILTALKGWVGHAPQGRGALHIIIFKLNDYKIKKNSHFYCFSQNFMLYCT